MNNSIRIIFGKEQVNKFLSEIPFSEEEKNINEKVFNFDTKIELDAFLKGVNESVGWNEVYQIFPEDLIES